jgi:hypothetical protein
MMNFLDFPRFPRFMPLMQYWLMGPDGMHAAGERIRNVEGHSSEGLVMHVSTGHDMRQSTCPCRSDPCHYTWRLFLFVSDFTR